MNLGEIAIYCGLDIFFNVGAYMCRLYESGIFGARAVLGTGASCDWWRPAPALHIGQRFFAPWLSQLCQEVGVEVLMVRFDMALLPLSVCSIPKDVC